MRTYSLIITECPLCGVSFKSYIVLKGLPRRSLGGKPLPPRCKSFKSSIYLKIEMAIVLDNKEVTPKGLGIDGVSLIYIIKA